MARLRALLRQGGVDLGLCAQALAHGQLPQPQVRLARLMGDGRRANDFVARYGGEEFCIVLVDTPKLTAAQLAERLRERVASHPFPNAGSQPGGSLTISMGVASFPDDASDSEALVRAADAALYESKRAGRNCVVLATPTRLSGPLPGAAS